MFCDNIELTKGRGKNLDLKSNGSAVKITVPRGYLPYGFSRYESDYGGAPSVNIEVLTNDDVFLASIRDMEARIIEKVAGMYDSTTVNANQFHSNIKNGRLRLKYRPKDTVLFDSEDKVLKTEITNRIFEKYSIECTATVTGVYFMNQKFGLIWQANHVRLHKPVETALKGFAFTNLED